MLRATLTDPITLSRPSTGKWPRLCVVEALEIRLQCRFYAEDSMNDHLAAVP